MAIFKCLILFFLLINNAFANQPVIQIYSASGDPYDGVRYSDSDPATLCNKVNQSFVRYLQQQGNNNPIYKTTRIEPAGVDYFCFSPSNDTSLRFVLSSVRDCPSGELLTNNNTECTGMKSCLAPSVLNPQTMVCETPKNCLSEQTLINGVCGCTQFGYALDGSRNFAGDVFPSTVCVGGCAFASSSAITLTVVPPITTTVYYHNRTTSTCTEPVPVVKENLTPLQVTEKSCVDAGLGFATINAITVCAAATSTGQKITAVSDKGIKTSTTTNNVTTVNTDNSTITNVVNNDGSITTVTTKVAANGDKTVTEAVTDKKTFCQENPNSNICKTSSIQTGCGSFACNGDAIQCAIAQRSYKDRCEADDAKAILESKPTYNTGQNLVNGNLDSDVTGFGSQDGKNNKTVNVPAALSESGQASFAGVGVQDVIINAQGRTINLQFSKTNQFFTIFGYVLLALSYLAAYRIIESGV